MIFRALSQRNRSLIGAVACITHLSALLLCPGLVSAQQVKMEPYLFHSQIEVNEQMNRFPTLKAEAFANIGAYWQADTTYVLEEETRRLAGEQVDPLTEEELAYFQTFRVADAISYLLERAENEQIIILNEAHHRPEHRVFASALLEGLAQRGYAYLGLEALTPNFDDPEALGLDTSLNERGYPLNSRYTGNYTREPQFGLFIRQAINNGFHLFGYERNPSFQEMIRDSAEALNVARILARDPDARILLYCGYAHLVESNAVDPESNYGRSRWMASYLRELTGIDPLTVNQEILTDRSPAANSPYYPLIKSEKPAVLLNEDGRVFNGGKRNDKFDLLVYHPPARLINGRPHWLYRDGAHRAYTIAPEQLTLNCPCQVRAYPETEPELAVPVDIIEIDPDFRENTLVLAPGQYRLIIENLAGDRQTLQVEIAEE
ncbi:hypothetical protein [Flavilitoribacter nigricans]|uniref:Uncharacterized protein n=1 Tax=Flavilitoribacter nigricans (strain ATCC 23147 / DSM 23189 / NBRC 102662 / NCIMB 1420 / SS-2) TaxID=1122177 RepID=A0A2D0NGG4_FLAN2|nr:hypothetical protein [Flavilitoribacter nigricans]PHN07476.1 hypothetical protein CRP01_05080 [Flavilitoribacter nigricans DSM 23189 = NBRC 102662]